MKARTVTKSSLCMAFVLMASAVWAGEYDSYYSMIRTSGSAWVNGWGWPGNTYPAAGAKCYVPAEYTLTISPDQSGTAFPGSVVAVAGRLQIYGIGTSYAWNSEFRSTTPFVLTPGSVFEVAVWNHHFYSPIEIAGTRENPALVRLYTEDTHNYAFYPYCTFTSAADAVVRFCVVPNNTNGRFQYYFSDSATGGADLSGYHGTILFDDRGATFAAYSVSMPGTLELANGAQAYLSGADATSSFGGLKIGRGSALHLSTANNTHTIAVADKLVLEPGATLDLKKINSFAIPSNDPVTHTVFTLAPAAVANGIPDFAGVNASLGYVVPIDSNRANSKTFDLPTVTLVTNFLAGGAAELCLRTRPVVKFTKGSGWNQTPFADGFDCTGYLSDDLPLHADADYYADGAYNINVQATGAKTVFPGHSLTLKGTSFGFYESYEFPNLHISSGTTFNQKRASNLWPGPITVAGNIKVHEKGWSDWSWIVLARNNFDWVIPANISGEGSIKFACFAQSDDVRNRWAGAVELSGDNSGYTGTMTVDFPIASSEAVFEKNGWEAFVPSAASNTTLTVHGKATLGGPLAAFDANALVVRDWCRLAFAETATFDEPTRGWSFPDSHAFWRVPAGKSVTVAQKIAYGAGTTIVKEGAGALYLAAAGTASDPDQMPTIEVAEGYLGVASSAATEAVKVSLGAKGGLAVKVGGEPIALGSPEQFEYVEFDEESGDELKLSMAVDMGGLETYAPKYTVKLLTYSSGSGWAMRFDGALGNPKLSLLNAPRGYQFGTMTAVAGDGDAVVLQVELLRKPTAFVVK